MVRIEIFLIFHRYKEWENLLENTTLEPQNFTSYMYKQNLGIGLGPMYTNLLINEDSRKGIIYYIRR